MAEPDPSRTVPPQPGRSFFWTLVRWGLTVLMIAVVAGLACLPSLVATPERVSRLVAAAVPELPADVKLSRLGVGWLGPIVFDDLQIVPRNGDKTPVTIRRIEVSNGLAGVLLSLGDLGRVRVEGLQADIEFDREHRSNLDSILPPDAPAEAAAAAKPSGGPRRSPVRVRLEIEDAVVRVSGPWTTDAWVSDPIDLRATLTNAADGYGEWTVEPVQLLAQAELQMTVAHEVLAYIVPVLADSARTSGRFSLRLDAARLPVGRPEAAELSGLLSMHEVNLGPGPLVENMFKSLPMDLPPPPMVRITDESNIEFRLVDRRMWHKGLKFGIPLKTPGLRLDVQSEGSVGLEDRSLDLKLTLPIPADLPQDRPLVAALAGKQISFGVGGVLGEPKVIFDGSIKAVAGQVLVDLIDRLREGPRPQPAAPAPQSPADPEPQPATPPQPAVAEERMPLAPLEKAEQMAAETAKNAGAEPGTTDAIVDIVAAVLEEVAKRRAERRAAEAANPDQAPPPKRGRLLQRRPPPNQPPANQAPPPAPPSPASGE